MSEFRLGENCGKVGSSDVFLFFDFLFLSLEDEFAIKNVTSFFDALTFK